MIDRWTVFIYRTPVAGIDQRLDSRGFWVRYKDHVAEVGRLREAVGEIANLDYTHAATNGAAYKAICIAKAALCGAVMPGKEGVK